MNALTMDSRNTLPGRHFSKLPKLSTDGSSTIISKKHINRPDNIKLGISVISLNKEQNSSNKSLKLVNQKDYLPNNETQRSGIDTRQVGTGISKEMEYTTASDISYDLRFASESQVLNTSAVGSFQFMESLNLEETTRMTITNGLFLSSILYYHWFL